jgi:SAM-dependent methyltransferase
VSDIEKIKSFYHERLERFTDESQRVGWRDRETQWLRFEALAGVAPLEGKSILDLGCGLGGMLDFLRARGWSGDYTGWDIHDGMIAECRIKFPGVRFENEDILKYGGEREFDIVFGSGLFCVPIADESFYLEVKKKMFALCREAAAFNLISSYVDYREDYLRYTDPAETFAFCKNNLSRFVALRHDYMKFEYTVYVYRRED